MLKSTKVKMLVSRRYGDTIVQIELSDDVGSYGESSVLNCTDMFAASIADAFENFEANALPRMNWGLDTLPPPETNNPNKLAIIFPNKLVRSLVDGKVYYKIFGGNWQKFGVRIWPEIIPTEMLDYMGEKNQLVLNPNNWEATIKMNEKGQPAKVLTLTRKGQ